MELIHTSLLWWLKTFLTDWHKIYCWTRLTKGSWVATTSSKCQSTKKVKRTKVTLSSTWRTRVKWKNSASSSTSTSGRMPAQAKCAWSLTRASRATRSCATVSRMRRSSVTSYPNPIFTHVAWLRSTTKSCLWQLKPHGGIKKRSLIYSVQVTFQLQECSNSAICRTTKQVSTRSGPKYSKW